MKTLPGTLRSAGRGGLVVLALLLPVLTWAAEAAAQAEEAGGNPLTRFNPGLMIWTWVTFGTLVALLAWKAWPSIVRSLELREETIRGAISQAKRDREEAQKLLEQHAAMIAQARRETAGLIEQGRKDAEQVRSEILDKARREQRE